MDEARELSLKLEQGDDELIDLWFKIRDWSMECFYKVYDKIQIPFDGMMGESFYDDKMPAVTEDGLNLEVFKKGEEGAIVFPGQTLSDPSTGKENPNVMKTRVNKDDKAEDMVWKDEIIVKPNGGTLYLTRDVATIRYRAEELGAEKIIYAVGKEQRPHFMMLFNIVDQLDYCKLGKAVHVSFGHLNMEGKKMKTREGKVILLNDILDESISAAKELIQKRKTDLGESSDLNDEEQDIANKVGIGTVIYNDLRQDREKDIEFNPDAAKSLESGGCPYIQYTYCRLGSILKKAEDYSEKFEVPADISQVEKKMLVLLSMFPNTVSEAMRSNSPHKIANSLDQLTQLVNTFYQSQDVNKAPEPLKSFRVALVKACQQVIRNASDLLHFEMPERM
jgi:arginyl-tRNA synthetase